jgi:transposase-like protein
LALSDSPNRQGIISKAHHKRDATTNTSWSDKQKLEAVQTYLMLGNLAMTCRVLKIPEQTVRTWRKSTWWKELEGELRIQDEMQLSARLKKVMEKSLDAVDERLEHGDFVYDQKTGQMRRKPVSMRDAHKVSMDLIDKRNLLLNNNKPDASEEQMNDKLLKMMKQFADFAQGKLNKEEVVDAEVKVVSDDAFQRPLYPNAGDGDDSGILQEEEDSSRTP